MSNAQEFFERVDNIVEGQGEEDNFDGDLLEGVNDYGKFE